MKARIKLSLGIFLLTSFGIASYAQQPGSPVPPSVQPAAPRGLTKEQQAALDKMDEDIGQIALTIVKSIDQGKAPQVWDAASPIAKGIISRDAFVQKVSHDRAVLGEPGMRMPMGIRHFRYQSTGNLPAGAYINVTFETQFAQAKQSALELVTFFLDSDNIWRFAGYSVR
ncbi:DUF4019 domain-containing protein [Caballeronia insecticola]|uniref:DUF4019 domain-containing protein n=1 Tax=Caballeronia insecticola TaxID=758793 RepID=R4X4C7_9BURK|nr:DUF4019 domain-containing protein [Caballeronia insecticola]BAN27182.1 putative uncharacterized protein [Caballeronia insecticola]